MISASAAARRAFSAVAELKFVGDCTPGADDERVLALAREEDRILVAEDLDFGRLISAAGIPSPPGLIHLVLAGMPKSVRDRKLTEEAAALIAAAQDSFVVFSSGPIRSRPLPRRA